MTEVAPNPTRREKATRQVRPRAECARKPGEALSAQDLSHECGRSGTQRAKNQGRGRKPGSGPKPWGSPKEMAVSAEVKAMSEGDGEER